MDKTDYAIIGWIDEGKPADPTKLAKMLGITASQALQRVELLRSQGAITHAWLKLFRKQIRRDYWWRIRAQKGT